MATLLAGLLGAGGASAGVIRLSGPMPGPGDVLDFQVSPDGQYVVYRADQDIDDVFELYSVSVLGGTPVRLNGLLPSGSSVADDYQISADSSRTVYRAPQDQTGVIELYSVPITGPAGAGVKLNRPLTASGSVLRFALSPDGSRVVYRADQDTDGVVELYSVPITGPALTGVKLNGSLVSGGGVSDVFLISPDGQYVIYRADQQTNEVYELYSVPITGPALAGVKLNGAMVAGGGVSWADFAVSPDSQYVVYRADQQIRDVAELYSVPIMGPAGAGVKLNGSLVAGGDVSSRLLISPDSGRVIYSADQEVDEVYELYSVPITGPAGAGAKLNGPLPFGGDVLPEFLISVDSARVVYVADQQVDEVYELYSVPVAGPAGAGIRLNDTLPPGGDVMSNFLISPDGARVVYRADAETDGVLELYSVPIAGPPAAGTRLNSPLPPGGHVRASFLVSPGSERVVYLADQTLDEVFDLFSAPITGPAGAALRLNEPLVRDGDVFASFALAPDGGQAIYRADQDAEAVIEVYAADIEAVVGFEEGTRLAGEPEGSLSLAVRLLNPTPGLTVTVDYAVTGGTATGGGVDYQLTAGSLSFAPGDVIETIDLILVDDGVPEPLETVALALSNAQNATLGSHSTLAVVIGDAIYPLYLPLAGRW
jgi:Tol biopolymer transport system component